MLPREASIDELVDILESPEYDAVREINEAINAQRSIQDLHPASVELMVRLNGYTQELTEALEQSLKQLLKSEKRLPHEIDLLKNDVHNFNTQLTEELPTVTELVSQSRRSPVFAELSSLHEVRSRILNVQELLLALREDPQKLSPATRAQLAEVLKDTPGEEKVGTTPSSQNYYDFINKIIK